MDSLNDWTLVLTHVFRWAALLTLVLLVVFLVRLNFAISRLVDWLVLHSRESIEPPRKPPEPPPSMGCDFGFGAMVPRVFK